MITKKTILLVEDNPDDQLLTMEALREEHHVINEIVVVSDGIEALDYLHRKGKYEDRNEDSDPAFVLLDLKLPKLSGLEVLKKIREHERTKFLPVIILTSSREESDLIEGYKLGTNGYVQKPVEFTQFSKTIKQLGGYWLLLNEFPSDVD